MISVMESACNVLANVLASSAGLRQNAGMGGFVIRVAAVAVICLSALVVLAPYHMARADLVGHGGMVRAVDVSPDGRRVLTGSFDFTARLWDFGLQSEIAVLDEHAGPVTSVAFLPDGRHGLTTSDDMTAILWDLETATPVTRLVGHKHKVMAVAVDRTGTRAATGGWDKTVRVWDLATGDTLRVIELGSPVNAVAFLGDGRVVSGSHDGKIRIWNANTGIIDGTLEGHAMGITGLSLAPDGRRLLSASIDKTIRIWDLASLSEVRNIKVHDGQVFGAVFSPDGRSALTAGRDGFVVQWDLAEGAPTREIRAHDRIVWAVRFTPDGRFAISGSSDDHARVWHLATGDRVGDIDEEAEAEEAQPWLTSDHPGAKLFTKCARCHTVAATGRRRSGPHLAGLFGRRAGSVTGYKYSSALTGVDFVWNEKTLFDLFDLGPDKVLPGTKMPVQRVSDAAQLTNLVDYLKQLTAGGGSQ